MDCSCEISPNEDYDHFYIDFTQKTVVAKTPLKCGECGCEIAPGEEYELTSGTVAENIREYERSENTCLSCVAVSKMFFKDGCTFGEIWDDMYEHLRCNNIPESCLSALPNPAREKCCELIETLWDSDDETLRYEHLRDVAVSADAEGSLPLSFFAEKLNCTVDEVSMCVRDNYHLIPSDIGNDGTVFISFYDDGAG